MAEKEMWDDFVSTGKVMDYLQYKGCLDHMTNLSDVTTGLTMAGNVPFTERNDRSKYEGSHYTDGDGASILSD